MLEKMSVVAFNTEEMRLAAQSSTLSLLGTEERIGARKAPMPNFGLSAGTSLATGSLALEGSVSVEGGDSAMLAAGAAAGSASAAADGGVGSESDMFELAKTLKKAQTSAAAVPHLVHGKMPPQVCYTIHHVNAHLADYTAIKFKYANAVLGDDSWVVPELN